MNNEDFARQMAFILEQQARFSANQATQQERDAQVSVRLDRVDRQIEQLVGFAGTLRDAVLGLTHHVERHDQQTAAINRQIAELVAEGKETDARLNALILIVERHIGGPQ